MCFQVQFLMRNYSSLSFFIHKTKFINIVFKLRNKCTRMMIVRMRRWKNRKKGMIIRINRINYYFGNKCYLNAKKISDNIVKTHRNLINIFILIILIDRLLYKYIHN